MFAETSQHLVKRNEVEHVFAVTLSPVEPVLNAQSLGAHSTVAASTPSGRLREKGIELEPAFVKFLDGYANVFRERPPGRVTERNQKHVSVRCRGRCRIIRGNCALCRTTTEKR